ncbi:coiled-coil domain-containing protein 25-like [Glossina fuscipes]|uniref:Coiled-coil domain-containing protein 25 n=1 Tax=Glossina fuscipes TaxID=7396 RepID=A0A9C5ZI95_9MUSC|nr:coiled-coil domain-containing protein 25-like [Glossina fuscipes]
MVFYFKSNVVDPPALLYMEKDKYENEELIKWGWPEDVWFHVDNLSSAHVYLRLEKGQTIDNIPTSVLNDVAKLVKANSVQGITLNNIDINYTMWQNLKKSADVEPGHVAYHNEKAVKKIRVEKRINDIVKRLGRTKTEENTDLRFQREQRDALEREEQRAEVRRQKELEKKLEKGKQQEQVLRNYTSLLQADKMTSNYDNGNETDNFW